MPKSYQTSQKFYNHLGTEGLAARTTQEWTDAVVDKLCHRISAGASVLDLGCGYGRVTLPLAQQGYKMHGLDASEVLVRDAKQSALGLGLDVELVVGDITRLPYPDNSFDAAISTWSAFNELLETEEQINCIKEVNRVLKPGGLAIFESFTYREPTTEELESGQRFGLGGRISKGIQLDRTSNPDFFHDHSSYSSICMGAGIVDWRTSIEKWGERKRLIFIFYKPTLAKSVN